MLKSHDVVMEENKDLPGGGTPESKPEEKPEQKPEQKLSVLGQGDKEEYSVDDKTGRPSIIPEKYWDAEKKALRVDAKGIPVGLAKGYGDLEKRLGAGELPPAKPEDYKTEPVLAAVKEKLKLDPKLDPELSKTFAKEAHEAGLTQKQYEWVMMKYFEQIPALASKVLENSFADAQKALQGVWPSDADMKANLSKAHRAFMAYAPEKSRNQEAMDSIGNNPLIVEILAAVGKDMGEDTRLDIEANLLGADGLTQLMRGGPGKPDSPYWNEDDPQHKRIVAQVQAHHEAEAKKKKFQAAS